MADAQEDDIEMGDETFHSPLQQGDAEQPGSHSQDSPQQPAWDPPRQAHVSEDIGLLGFFADIEQQAQPPREELEKLLPGRDGSVLVRASPLIIAKQYNDKYWAERVCYFLSHTPPGVDESDESGVFIAHVNWYNHLPQGQNMSATLNCPIFKTSFKDDKGGNMWPVEKLAPCKLGAVHLKGRKDRIVILNRFSTFLDCVPG